MTTPRSKDLSVRYSTPAFKALESLQNTHYFSGRDIITITGFMKTEEEVQAHLQRHQELLSA
jgi:hypothetical protein